MDDEKYAASFDIIMKAGDAKSNAMMAVEEAKNRNFEEARRLLDEARQEMIDSHVSQTELIQAEANGNPVEMNIILVHAQDHFSMATTAIDFAEHFIDLYEEMSQIEETVNQYKTMVKIVV